jgi:hypothetical protein
MAEDMTEEPNRIDFMDMVEEDFGPLCEALG